MQITGFLTKGSVNQRPQGLGTASGHGCRTLEEFDFDLLFKEDSVTLSLSLSIYIYIYLRIISHSWHPKRAFLFVLAVYQAMGCVPGLSAISDTPM